MNHPRAFLQLPVKTLILRIVYVPYRTSQIYIMEIVWPTLNRQRTTHAGPTCVQAHPIPYKFSVSHPKIQWHHWKSYDFQWSHWKSYDFQWVTEFLYDFQWVVHIFSEWWCIFSVTHWKYLHRTHTLQPQSTKNNLISRRFSLVLWRPVER